MDKPGIVLLGAGGHAQSCIDVLEQQGQFQIMGLIGSVEELNNTVLGYEVLGTDSDLKDIFRKCSNALNSIGQIHLSNSRARLFSLGKSIGFSFPSVISPHAYVSPYATIGEGTIVMHGAVVNAGARIGNNCIINSQSLVEHGVEVKNDCHISTGATLNGDVTVGTGSFVGSGVVVKEGIQIVKNSVVRMGSYIYKNVDNMD